MPVNQRYSSDRCGALLMPLAYEPDSEIFYCADQTIGFGFLCRPLTAGDPKAAERLNVMLKDAWPTDTIVQFILIGSQNIQPPLFHMRQLRAGQEDPLLLETVEQRAKFLTAGVNDPVEKRSGLRVRDIQLVVTIKLPLSGNEPTQAELDRASEQKVTVQKSLESVGLGPTPLSSQAWLDVMVPLINQGKDASWRLDGTSEIETDKLLRDQVFDYQTDLKVNAKGLSLGETRVRTLSIKRFPQRIYFGQAANFIGDMWEGIRGIRVPFMISASLHYPDPQKAKAGLSTKRQWATNQAIGRMRIFVPKLAQRKDDFDVLFEALDDGDRTCRLSLSMTLFADDDDAATGAVSSAQAYWGEMGYNLLPDKFFCLPIFLNALPFGAEKKAIKELFRYKTMATRQAVPLLPVFGDWRGTGTPVLNLISRNGQLMSLSLYDSTSNYNTTIAAQSGSGKSFLTNELISSTLSMGGRVWVIDVGRSYEKLCELLDGDFIHFGKGTSICLNPFELIQAIEDGEDFEDQEDVLVGLLAAMAAPTEGLSDLQTQEMKRALHETWEAKGNQMVVDDMIEWFLREGEAREDNRISDLGHQLYSFSKSGQYGKYFNGKNNVAFNNRFTVLELEELKGRKHLQQVVLLQLIYQIQQEMYLGERDRPKLVIIDEAWDLLMHGDVAKFIEHGYRRFRKYGGAAVTITQGVGDLYAAPTGRAIVENSANMYLLGQKPEAIDALKKESRLPLTEGGYELLKTVHTVPGEYSEIFAITSYGCGIGRLIVDPFRQLIYSTKAEEVNAIKRLSTQGVSVRDAVYMLIEERNGGNRRSAA